MLKKKQGSGSVERVGHALPCGAALWTGKLLLARFRLVKNLNCSLLYIFNFIISYILQVLKHTS
jgi:hypothetical protein